MNHIFGCPMHYGVGAPGLINSLDYLQSFCPELDIHILPEITRPEENLSNLKYLNSVIANCSQIAESGYHALCKGESPLYISGDHSSAIGSVSAAGTYCEDLGLIWIDAHPDINTDKTTVTGNIHGMPVAALIGMGEQSLTRILSDKPKVKPSNIVMLGLRDIDPPEMEFLNKLNIRYYTWQQMATLGIQRCIDETLQYLAHLQNVHISFDIDVMDPAHLPGVSVPVPGGLLEEEAFTLMHQLLTGLHVISCDIVEFNKDYDISDQTATFTRQMAHQILTDF